jgi:hypothetical protein
MSYIYTTQVEVLKTPMTEEQFDCFESICSINFPTNDFPSIDKTNPDFQAFYAANVQAELDRIRNHRFNPMPLPEVTNDELIEILMKSRFIFRQIVEATFESERTASIIIDDYDPNTYQDQYFLSEDEIDELFQQPDSADYCDPDITRSHSTLWCFISATLTRPHIFADKIDSNFNPENLLAA